MLRVIKRYDLDFSYQQRTGFDSLLSADEQERWLHVASNVRNCRLQLQERRRTKYHLCQLRDQVRHIYFYKSFQSNIPSIKDVTYRIVCNREGGRRDHLTMRLKKKSKD